MLLANFRPRSKLVTKTTPVNTPRWPVLDAHNHLAEPFGGGWDKRRVDGANAFQEFWLVVIPLLRRTVLLTSVLTVISSLQVFVIFQLLTRGGPRNQTQTMLLSIYENAFRFANNLGLSAAMSMILFVIILILTVLQFRALRTEWEY
jgi:ABC-type sugar transport system permease subunit